MKWSVLIALAIFFVIFIATATALILYVRHWAARERLNATHGYILEGRYFSRFLPPSLQERYDFEKQKYATARAGRVRRLRIVFTVALFGLLIGVAGSPFLWHLDEFLSPIDLDQAERNALLFSRQSWDARSDMPIPDLTATMKGLRGLILISSPGDLEWKYQSRRISRLAMTHWIHFSTRHSLELVYCAWREANRCRQSQGKWIWVALPGLWRLGVLEQLTGAGESVILYGPPRQAIDSSGGSLEWGGLTFLQAGGRASQRVALCGDEILTLGFDAGLVIDAPALSSGYKVVSSRPQAVSEKPITNAGVIEGNRLFAGKLNSGRLVWLDFAPDAADHYAGMNVDNLDGLIGAVFRYLLGESYSAWATWPWGKKFAAFISEDTGDKFYLSQKVRDVLSSEGFPVTWFMLSNVALENRKLARHLGEIGEVACHGDSHLPFTRSSLREQTTRLARCQKVLEEITGEKPAGFRPPEERYNQDTLNAISNVKMEYYFGDNVERVDRAVPMLVETRSSSAQLVSLPRFVTDDYSMWYKGNLDYAKTIRILKEDLDWLEQVGGLFGFSFHSQYMDDPDHLKAVVDIGRELRQRDAYFTTSKRIASWWRLRDRLRRNAPVDEIVMEYFNPVRLVVTEGGELVKGDSVHAYRGIAKSEDTRQMHKAVEK